MKKLSVMLVVAVIIALSGNAMAFDIKSAGKEVVGTATTAGLSKDLQRYECTWNDTTNKVQSCYDKNKKKTVELNTVAGVLTTAQKGTEAGLKGDTNVNVHCKTTTVCRETAKSLKNLGVKGYDISWKTDSTLGNKVYFSLGR